MSTRGRTIVRRLLGTLLSDGRERRLKGSPASKSSVIHQATAYIAQLEMTPKTGKPIPATLNGTLATLRKNAADKKLDALHRLKAIRSLLLVEGIELPSANRNAQESDAIEEFIRQEMNAPKPERVTKTFQETRAEQRRQALADVIAAFEQDRANGCFKNVTDVILRLPEMPAPLPEVNLAEQHKEELQRVLDMF